MVPRRISGPIVFISVAQVTFVASLGPFFLLPRRPWWCDGVPATTAIAVATVAAAAEAGNRMT